MNQQDFISITKKIVIVLVLLSLIACKNAEKKKSSLNKNAEDSPMFFKMSLAQWSLHKAILEEKISPFDFAKEANALDIHAIEYVSQLYKKEVSQLGLDTVIERLKEESKKYGVKNLLIMVDGEGDLANTDENKLNEAVENHKKWVDAAKVLGCHSIRVNAHGQGTDVEVMANAVIGLAKLSEYAKTKGINVLVENHGGYTSNGGWLATVIQKVNMSNCGTLPDFGNFCLKGSQSINSENCENAYDIYKGVKELMPYAKAVSAKSYDFDENGNQPKIDYTKILQVVKNAGYTGYIGIEYEGSNLSEIDGIIATKKLLEKASKEVK
jgi:sugar phosphate isomerase/epimerase